MTTGNPVESMSKVSIPSWLLATLWWINKLVFICCRLIGTWTWLQMVQSLSTDSPIYLTTFVSSTCKFYLTSPRITHHVGILFQQLQRISLGWWIIFCYSAPCSLDRNTWTRCGLLFGSSLFWNRFQSECWPTSMPCYLAFFYSLAFFHFTIMFSAIHLTLLSGELWVHSVSTKSNSLLQIMMQRENWVPDLLMEMSYRWACMSSAWRWMHLCTVWRISLLINRYPDQQTMWEH